MNEIILLFLSLFFAYYLSLNDTKTENYFKNKKRQD